MAGNCNADDEVAISELQQCINLFLGDGMLAQCPRCDSGGEPGEIGVTDIQAVVNCFLDGSSAACPLVSP
jgi:hypothetical protein